jgi:hypothetical protein
LKFLSLVAVAVETRMLAVAVVLSFTAHITAFLHLKL